MSSYDEVYLIFRLVLYPHPPGLRNAILANFPEHFFHIGLWYIVRIN